jgi:tetratricopeptide (TPR) repeat protein
MTKTIVLATLLATATSTLAQPAAPPQTEDQKRAAARALYEKGLSHYNLGEFDQAIKAFKEAYAISQAPGLLFNVAQSYRLKKDYEQATYFYQTYLRLKPDAPNRADVEERLKEMQEAIEEQKKLGAKPPIGTVTPEGTLVTTTTTTTTTGPSRQPEQPVVAEGVKNQSLITAGYATAGAGAALVVTGLVFGRMAKSAEQDLERLGTTNGTWTQAQQDLYDTGKRNNTIAIISFIAGGAAIATGATLWVLGNQKQPASTLAIDVSKSGTSFAVGWGF